MTRRRIITWSLVLGAVFPDSDVFRDWFSKNELLMLTWHRSITHSLICLPIWAILLAALTFLMARWRKWPAPSFLALCGIWAVGILSHIFLDLVTTFGTMIWSPLQWSRPASDILFIVDFTFTAILLIPQLLAWTFEDLDHIRRRAFTMCMIFVPAPFLIAKIAQIVGAPISDDAIFAATVLFAVLFLVPSILGWGARIPYVAWNRAGIVFSPFCTCLLLRLRTTSLFSAPSILPNARTFKSSHWARSRFLLLLWRWDGLVLAPRGVYEIRLDLSDQLSRKEFRTPPNPIPPPKSSNTNTIQTRPRIALSTKLGVCLKSKRFLWFARFPVTRFHPEGTDAVVEFSDLRFPQIRPDRPASFTYRVRFSADGTVLSQAGSSANAQLFECEVSISITS